VSAVAAGRILNTKTARRPILGSVAMGIAMALHEGTLTDHKFGRIVNANFGEYQVPVNADIQDIEVIFVDEPDTINPLGIKGVGEIGMTALPDAAAPPDRSASGRRPPAARATAAPGRSSRWSHERVYIAGVCEVTGGRRACTEFQDGEGIGARKR
jgi:hypothetical protein